MSVLQFGVALVVYYALHSLLAYPVVKAYFSRRWNLARYYRILYNLISVFLLGPVYYFYRGIEKKELWENVSGWQEGLGGVMIVASIGLGYWALRQYDLSEFSGMDQFRGQAEVSAGVLNTQGLNSWVRHPLYSAALLFFWGLFLALPTAAILMLAIISTGYLWIGIRLEEQKLLQVFGEEYARYQERVPMLIPRWSNG